MYLLIPFVFQKWMLNNLTFWNYISAKWGKNGEMFFVRCRLHASLEKYVIVAQPKIDLSFT